MDSSQETKDLARRAILTCLRADVDGDTAWHAACEQLAAFEFRGVADIGHVAAGGLWFWSQATGRSLPSLVMVLRDDCHSKIKDAATLARAELCVDVIREFVRQPRKSKQLDAAVKRAGEANGLQNIAMLSWIGGVVVTQAAVVQGVSPEDFLVLHALDEEVENIGD